MVFIRQRRIALVLGFEPFFQRIERLDEAAPSVPGDLTGTPEELLEIREALRPLERQRRQREHPRSFEDVSDGRIDRKVRGLLA